MENIVKWAFYGLHQAKIYIIKLNINLPFSFVAVFLCFVVPLLRVKMEHFVSVESGSGIFFHVFPTSLLSGALHH